MQRFENIKLCFTKDFTLLIKKTKTFRFLIIEKKIFLNIIKNS